MRRIYLDYNATTPIAPSVQEAMMPFLTEHFGDPSGNHAWGRACQEAVEDARAKVAALLGAERDEIVFTSGGSESNNMALKGVVFHDAPPIDRHVVISAVEHAAVTEPARFLQRLGCRVSIVACDDQGLIDPLRVKAALRPDTRLVSIIHANHETGVIQPIREIAELCHANGVLVHTDAAQSAGKIPTLANELEVDLMSIAGHKLYAPKGIGALYLRRGVVLEPLLHGTAHEGGLRAGIESVASIVALGQAARLAFLGLEDSAARLATLRDRLCLRLQKVVGAGMVVNGSRAPRLPNTLSVLFRGLSGAELLARLPELCAATGAACHSFVAGVPPTLAAMGVAPDEARGNVRFSLGWFTSQEDIDLAAEMLIGAWEALQSP